MPHNNPTELHTVDIIQIDSNRNEGIYTTENAQKTTIACCCADVNHLDAFIYHLTQKRAIFIGFKRHIPTLSTVNYFLDILLSRFSEWISVISY